MVNLLLLHREMIPAPCGGAKPQMIHHRGTEDTEEDKKRHLTTKITKDTKQSRREESKAEEGKAARVHSAGPSVRPYPTLFLSFLVSFVVFVVNVLLLCPLW